MEGLVGEILPADGFFLVQDLHLHALPNINRFIVDARVNRIHMNPSVLQPGAFSRRKRYAPGYHLLYPSHAPRMKNPCAWGVLEVEKALTVDSTAQERVIHGQFPLYQTLPCRLKPSHYRIHLLGHLSACWMDPVVWRFKPLIGELILHAYRLGSS